jgi:hypothetical protein
MTNKGIITAATVLGLCILLSVGLVLHRQDVLLREQERKADCAEQRAGFDRCISVTPPGGSLEIYNQCKVFWKPVIDKACYGIDTPLDLSKMPK